jgi:hypothetical protein
MLARSGAKLVDFGLAKTASEKLAPALGLTDVATEAKPLPTEGTILGTCQYMAPGQFEGLEADARTDIFASAPSSTRWRRDAARSREGRRRASSPRPSHHTPSRSRTRLRCRLPITSCAGAWRRTRATAGSRPRTSPPSCTGSRIAGQDRGEDHGQEDARAPHVDRRARAARRRGGRGRARPPLEARPRRSRCDPTAAGSPMGGPGVGRVGVRS